VVRRASVMCEGQVWYAGRVWRVRGECGVCGASVVRGASVMCEG
jgi:hypothetical protein